MEHLLVFWIICIAAFLVFTYLWPRLMLYAYKRAVLKVGFGDGPIPMNTLYVEPQEVFRNPLDPSYKGSKLAVTGVNRDTLLVVGWLDLSKGPLVLHVPDMGDRYYAVQFTDPSRNIVFAYVGTRTTGAKAGEYLITGPNWKNALPKGMTQIASPNNAVFAVSRVFVADDSDLEAAYKLATQIQLRPFV